MQYRLKQLSYSICSLFAPILLVEERFDQRLTEYSAFWASLLALCENYCAEVQPALQQMSQFLRDAEVAADVRDAVSAAQMEASERNLLEISIV
eukprot:g32065.t1